VIKIYTPCLKKLFSYRKSNSTNIAAMAYFHRKLINTSFSACTVWWTLAYKPLRTRRHKSLHCSDNTAKYHPTRCQVAQI